MPSMLSFRFMEGYIMDNVWGIFGGFWRLRFDVVTGDVRHTGDSQPCGVPPFPTQEQVLSPPPIIPGEVCVGEGSFGK